MSDDPSDEVVTFRNGELIMAVGYLTNAIINLTSAVELLRRDDRDAAGIHSRNAGEQVDKVLALFEAKLGPKVVTRER